MEAEALPFVEHLDLKQRDDLFPAETAFLAYTGQHGDAEVTVITGGKDSVYGTTADNIGTVSASLKTFLALQKVKPDILINAGTCGGFRRKGAEIGDVFLTTATSFHDRRIPLPEFDVYGVGKIETHGFSVEHMAAHHDFKTGVCTTGNSLDKTDEDDQRMLANDATVKDMEAGAIAWSCKLHNIPFLGVKVVTDIVDGEHPTHEEFMRNLMTASKKLQEALQRVLEYVSGKAP